MAILEAFLSVASQWRTESTADGRILWFGLDYSACRDDLELSGRTIAPATWAGVKLMERAATAALNGVRG